MYSEFYNLRGSPFRLNPDHRFFFVAEPHEKAIAHLKYALNRNEGFVVITGEVGAGKTTLVNRMLSDLEESRYITGNIVTSFIEHEELVSLVAATFGIETEGKNKASLLLSIRNFLEEERVMGRRPILFVDEVQNLPESSLEELRMLSNFCLPGESLLQIFLVGQPEFRETLADERMEQLRQRVVTSCHLGTLGLEDTRSYILHRLNLASWRGDPAFSDRSFELIHHLSGGVPRRINVICDRLLLHGFLEELHRVDSAVVGVVARDMTHEGLLKVPDIKQPTETSAASGIQETAQVAQEEEPANDDRFSTVEIQDDRHDALAATMADDSQEDDTLLLEKSQRVILVAEAVVHTKEGETREGSEHGTESETKTDSEPDAELFDDGNPFAVTDTPQQSKEGLSQESAEDHAPKQKTRGDAQLSDDIGESQVQAEIITLRRRFPVMARAGMAAAVVLALLILPETTLFRQTPDISSENLQLSLEVEAPSETGDGASAPAIIPTALTTQDDKPTLEGSYLLPASTASEPELLTGGSPKLEELRSGSRQILVVPKNTTQDDGQGVLTSLPPAEPESLLKPETAELSEKRAVTEEDQFFIQLVALRSADEAGRLQAQFVDRLGGLLSSYDLGIQKGQIAGTQYFRVMTGVAGDREEMMEICASIKEGGQDCILVLDTGA